MGKIISLEFKKNKKMLSRIVIFNLILIVLALILRIGLGLSNIFRSNILANGIFAAGLICFMIFNLAYILSSIHKDLYDSSAYLTFSLPIGRKKYFTSKNISFALIYLINILFLFVIYRILGYKITSFLAFYFLLGLIWQELFAQIASLSIQMARFRQNKMPFVLGVVIFILVFALGFVLCKYFSIVLVDGAIQKAGPLNYAFIYPFAIGNYGLYKNFTPLMYYIIMVVLLYFINSNNLDKNLDL